MPVFNAPDLFVPDVIGEQLGFGPRRDEAFSSPMARSEFYQRLRLTKPASEAKTTAMIEYAVSGINWYESRVTLSLFARWAVNVMQWVVPAEFAALAPTEATDPAPEPATNGPLPRQRWQEAEILRKLKALGYDPKALPKPVPGKGGAKAAVRAALLSEDNGKWGHRVFPLAWERLRGAGEIADATPSN